MKNIFLLFPVQLFKNSIQLKKHDIIYLIEDPIYFCDYQYHKLKLAYHVASMKSYENDLIKKGFDVKYIKFNEATPLFYKNLNSKNISIQCYEPFEIKLTKKLQKYIPSIKIIESLNFLVSTPFVNETKYIFCKNGKYNHLNFYKMQRKRLHILMLENDQPKGGKWSFDQENREKIPKDQEIPDIPDLKYNKNKYVQEAIVYINKYFPKNYGSLDHFIYPINHKDAKKWLLNFIKYKFKLFGPYEDAETMRDPFLFHSILSPMMNIGLLTDKEVLDIILPYENEIPLSSFEGFIRQIIGWRNFVLSIYILDGENIKKMNFMKHKNKINKRIMWSGSIGILPFDNVIKKINKYGYAHHIERLMYLGNLLFLLQIKPDDVFRAFMEWTVDAYDWVMVANVYCMSQHADGGLMMTKPYFSSSNYILNMSDYKKEDWCVIWNALYYNFINTHQKYLKKNYSWAKHVSFWNKKTNIEKKEIFDITKSYIKNIGIKNNV